MNIQEIEAQSILRKHKKIDSWFISRYGMNLYRGCIHNCGYCDGRSEGYYVDGNFGKDIVVKTNAVQLLEQELNPERKHKPFNSGFILVGGGVCDSYGPIEKKYQLTKKTLDLIHQYNFPVHVLTKSTLIKRDIEILKKINKKKRAIVSFSFSSVDNKISEIFESGVPPPNERLETLRIFKDKGIYCGMYLLPVIPFISDTPDLIEKAFKKAKELNLDFINFGGMTLKEGKQKLHFDKILKSYKPNLLPNYANIYQGNKWGQATSEYYHSIHETFYTIARKYKVPVRIPPYIYSQFLNKNDLVVVILEHLDYLLKLRGQKSPYGYAAYSISQLKEPLVSNNNNFRQIKGVGLVTAQIIREILETGKLKYLEKLLMN